MLGLALLLSGDAEKRLERVAKQFLKNLGLDTSLILTTISNYRELPINYLII